MKLPSDPGVGPETVPEAKRSPGRTDAPLAVMWASCWAGVQYMSANDVRADRERWETRSRIAADSSCTSRWRSNPHGSSVRRYAATGGTWVGGSTRCGASASKLTSQGDTDVAKLLPRNGPSGWYSYAWMSRADQSLTRHIP